MATVQLDAVAGAATMAAFGLGTIPAMLVTAFGAQRFQNLPALPGARYIAGTVLLFSAALTLAGPWLEHTLPALHAWLPFLCGTGATA
jgi:sulfite exporter TauE/SafE